VSKIEPDMKEENIGEIIDYIVERCKGLNTDIKVKSNFYNKAPGITIEDL